MSKQPEQAPNTTPATKSEQLELLGHLYFTSLFNQRFHDLTDRSGLSAQQTRAYLRAMQQKKWVWKDREDVYHLTKNGVNYFLQHGMDYLAQMEEEMAVFTGDPEIIPDEILLPEATDGYPQSRLSRWSATATMLLFWLCTTLGGALILNWLAGLIFGAVHGVVTVIFLIIVGIVAGWLLIALLLNAAHVPYSFPFDDLVDPDDTP